MTVGAIDYWCNAFVPDRRELWERDDLVSRIAEAFAARRVSRASEPTEAAAA